MAEDKKTKWEFVDTPDYIKDVQNAINEVVPKVQKMGADAGKQISETIRKCYENIGYKFREVEIEPEENQSAPKLKNAELNLKKLYAIYPKFETDKDTLIAYKVMKKTANGFQWLFSNASLAEYFQNMDISKDADWKIIEPCFIMKDNQPCKHLAQSAQQANESKDYQKIKKYILHNK